MRLSSSICALVLLLRFVFIVVLLDVVCKV
jgi:hypothetical protein